MRELLGDDDNDDDDSFYDRTGQGIWKKFSLLSKIIIYILYILIIAERAKLRKIQQPQKVETYESLTRQREELTMKIKEIRSRISNAKEFGIIIEL